MINCAMPLFALTLIFQPMLLGVKVDQSNMESHANAARAFTKMEEDSANPHSYD